MKKTKINAFGLALLALLLSSCAKYEDGPSLSLRSPEKRIIGLWECSKVMVGGVDQTAYYQSDSVYLRFSVAGTRDELFISLVEDTRASGAVSSSLLSFDDKKKAVVFGLPEYALYRDITEPLFELLPAIHVQNTWTLQRLSVSEWNMNVSYGNVLYELELSKLESYDFNP